MELKIEITFPKEIASLMTSKTMINEITNIKNNIRRALVNPGKNELKKYVYNQDYYLSERTQIIKTFYFVRIDLRIKMLLNIQKQEDFFNRLYTISVKYAEKKNYNNISFYACGHVANLDTVVEEYHYASENYSAVKNLKKHQLNFYNWYRSPLVFKIDEWKDKQSNIVFPLYFHDENDSQIQKLLQFLKLQTLQDLITMTDANGISVFHVCNHNIFLVKKIEE